VVASKIPPPSPAATIAEKPTRGPAVRGAMTQQRDDLSNQSAPQKFVRLVGCRASAKP
jgi:hypothetical protein